jgi:hypothetical protein
MSPALSPAPMNCPRNEEQGSRYGVPAAQRIGEKAIHELLHAKRVKALM